MEKTSTAGLELSGGEPNDPQKASASSGTASVASLHSLISIHSVLVNVEVKSLGGVKMLNFILGCIILVIIFYIGMLFLGIILNVIVLVITLVFSSIAWLWNKLTN